MQEQCIFAGFGGQGTLLIGKLLASGAMMEGKEVTWLPSYGPEMRGGTANCTVVVSDRPIAAPVVTSPDTVIAMNLPSLVKFEQSIKSGGVLLINSTLIDVKSSRADLRVVYIPAGEIAEQAGNPKGANMVMLGGYLAMKGEVVGVEHVVEAMEEDPGLGKRTLLDGNIRGLYAGMEYVKNLNF